MRSRYIAVGWKQLKHNKLRLLAALAGITFAVLLMLVQQGFLQALYASAVRWHDALDYDLVMLSPKTQYLLEANELPRNRLAQADGVEGVRSVTAVYIAQAPWRNPERPKQVLPIFIMAFDPTDEGFSAVAGPAQRELLKRADYYLFDRGSRSEFGPIPSLLEEEEVLTMEMNGRRIHVGGLFHVGTSFAINGALLTSDLNFLRLLPNRRSSNINLGLIHLEKDSVPEQVRDAIVRVIPGDVRVLTREEFKRMEIQYWDTSTAMGYVFNLGVTMGFVVGLIIVYQILFSDVQDHLQEYATLKAMGYTNGFLARIVLQEAVILAVAGFIPALLLTGQMFSNASEATNLPLTLTMELSLRTLGLTMAMCVVSGLLALRKVRAADPAEVF